MIHYSIWFNFRDAIDEPDALEIIHTFLSQLYDAGSIAGFQILKNTGDAARTKMLRFQALIEFRDEAQFSAAFSAQAASGIHTGLHGRVTALVSDFCIEIFKQISASGSPSTLDPFLQYGCEV